MPGIDLGALAAQATEILNTETATPATPSTPTPEVAPPVSADTSATPQTPETPVATPPTVEPTFDVDMGNGKVEKLTQAQLRDAYLNGLRQSDYTRKTQELAQQRQQLEQAAVTWQQTQQRLQQYEQLVNDPNALQRLAEQQRIAQTPIDPNAPMTVGQAQMMAQAIAQQLEQVRQMAPQNLQQVQQAAQAIVEDRMAVSNYAESINGTLGKIYAENPVLKAIPEFEDILRYKVASLEPSSLEEAQKHFEAVSKDFVSKLTASYEAKQKQNEVQRQNLAKGGIEPPGGQAAPLQKPEYFKDGKMNWDKLHEAARNIQ